MKKRHFKLDKEVLTSAADTRLDGATITIFPGSLFVCSLDPCPMDEPESGGGCPGGGGGGTGPPPPNSNPCHSNVNTGPQC